MNELIHSIRNEIIEKKRNIFETNHGVPLTKTKGQILFCKHPTWNIASLCYSRKKTKKALTQSQVAATLLKRNRWPMWHLPTCMPSE